MTDLGKDNFIKEQLENDTLISKNADAVFNNFLKGEMNMKQNQVDETVTKEEKKPYKPNKHNGWMKFVGVAACFVIVFAGANVYATTKGYENIFFMIKDLVQKEDVQIVDKAEILYDRDITISYSNIEIEEGLHIQINRLVIKDSEAKLYLHIIKDITNQTNIKKYIVTDITGNKNTMLASQEATMETNVTEQSEEIILKGIENTTQKLKLEIKDDKGDTLIVLEIDLLNKELDLLSYGKSDTFEKLSETELKDILGLYAYLNVWDNSSRENLKDLKTNLELDIAMYMVGQKGDKTTKENVHKAIKEYLGKEITDTIIDKTGDIYFEDGEYKYSPRDGLSPALVLDVADITYQNGTYTATIIYCFPGEDWSNIEQLEQYETTMEFVLNTNYTYTKYCLINADEMIQKIYKTANNSNVNNGSNGSEANNSLSVSTLLGEWKVYAATDKVGNNKELSNVFGTGIGYSNSLIFYQNGGAIWNIGIQETCDATYEIKQNKVMIHHGSNEYQLRYVADEDTLVLEQWYGEEIVYFARKIEEQSNDSNDYNAQNVDNYASTMDWKEYSAPGLKFIYPTSFYVEEIGGDDRGNRPGEISTKIVGVAVGKDPDTGKIIKSDLMITIYEPLYLDENVDISQYTTGSHGYEKCSINTKNGLKWYEDDYKDEYGSKETYTCIRKLIGCYDVHKIEFQTGKDWSFKVRNITNWLMGSTEIIEKAISFEEMVEKQNIGSEKLDTSIFVKDFDNYNPSSNDVLISQLEAKRIAQYGFFESKLRIAGEGADDVDSETVKLEEVYANNYFTRKYTEGDKNYMKRMCYVIRRENEMGNGIKIYVDATTGLIVGAASFGD